MRLTGRREQGAQHGNDTRRYGRSITCPNDSARPRAANRSGLGDSHSNLKSGVGGADDDTNSAGLTPLVRRTTEASKSVCMEQCGSLVAGQEKCEGKEDLRAHSIDELTKTTVPGPAARGRAWVRRRRVIVALQWRGEVTVGYPPRHQALPPSSSPSYSSPLAAACLPELCAVVGADHVLHLVLVLLPFLLLLLGALEPLEEPADRTRERRNGGREER